jgi:hypothetical protein
MGSSRVVSGKMSPLAMFVESGKKGKAIQMRNEVRPVFSRVSAHAASGG